MARRTWWIPLIALLLLAACGPREAADDAPAATSPSATDDGLRTRVEVEGADPTVGPATVTVYLLEEGEGVTGATVEVTGDMTHAGMAPVTAEAPQAEPGLYRTEGFAFTMAGDWILTADITLPDGTTRRATTQARVSAP